MELTANEIAIGVSCISLATSFLAYWRSIKHHSDSSTSNLIRQNYEDMLRLHELRAEYPNQSHLFEIKGQYDRAKALIKDANENSPEERIILLSLEERAIARRVFSMYEGSFYQWKNATSHNDKWRTAFLKDVLDYFTSRLLTNPRLVWLWSAEGGGLCVHYENETVAYYRQNVRNDRVDEVGPFALNTAEEQKEVSV